MRTPTAKRPNYYADIFRETCRRLTANPRLPADAAYWLAKQTIDEGEAQGTLEGIDPRVLPDEDEFIRLEKYARDLRTQEDEREKRGNSLHENIHIEPWPNGYPGASDRTEQDSHRPDYQGVERMIQEIEK